MQKITSRDNQKIKLTRKVRDGHVKGYIFVEGFRLVKEALNSKLQDIEIFVSHDFTGSHDELISYLSENSIEVNVTSNSVFDSISDTKSSQGMVLISKKPSANSQLVEKALQSIDSNLSLVLLLHKINNPINLGAVLRVAEAVGIAGIITTKNSADVFSPKALRGAMGASFRLPIWTDADFEEVLIWAKKQQLITTSTDSKAQKTYLETDWKTPRLLVFGSEANGLSIDERNKTDEQILIPMENNVESLNLAVSSGVILFEAKRANSLIS